MKKLILILSLFATVSFGQNAKEIEILKEMNKYKFPAPPMTFSPKLNAEAKSFAKKFNDYTTRQDMSMYFQNSDYCPYAAMVDFDYNGADVVAFFEETDVWLKEGITASKEVGIYASKDKVIIFFYVTDIYVVE